MFTVNSLRSALATKTLNDLGYKNAVLMNAHSKNGSRPAIRWKNNS